MSVVLLGDSGTRTTHLLIGLGIAACEQGLRVCYVTAAALVNELVEARTSGSSAQWSGTPDGAPLVAGDDRPGIGDLDRGISDPRGEGPAGGPRRDRVEALADAHPRSRAG